MLDGIRNLFLFKDYGWLKEPPFNVRLTRGGLRMD